MPPSTVLDSRVEATRLASGLYQGSRPPAGNSLRRSGFDAVVLSAMEIQPSAADFPGVRVIRARLDDSGTPISRREWDEAVRAASEATAIHRRGGRVLVTCAQGRNRSGLVAAVMLHQLSGDSGAHVVSYIQRTRRAPGGPALTNDSFVSVLSRLRARGPARR